MRIIKRMETRLRQSKGEPSQMPFFDNKTIEGCLSDSTIDQLLKYYGQAFKYNEYNLDIIEKAVCITFFHILSVDDNQFQNLSSKDWCKHIIVGAKLYLQEFVT